MFDENPLTNPYFWGGALVGGLVTAAVITCSGDSEELVEEGSEPEAPEAPRVRVKAAKKTVVREEPEDYEMDEEEEDESETKVRPVPKKKIVAKDVEEAVEEVIKKKKHH